MISLSLHPMKEIKIVVQGDHLNFVTDLLDRAGATGYTIINNVPGKGHHGFHEGYCCSTTRAARSSCLPSFLKNVSSRSWLS